MSQLDYQATKDGQGYYANHEGYRLVVKEDDDHDTTGDWWWGVYEGDMLVEHGSAGDEEDAKDQAERTIGL